MSFGDTIDEDLYQETEYVYTRLVDMTNRDELLHYEEQAKKKIRRVLTYFRKDYLDVMMVAKYRKYDYMSELQEEDVWRVFNLDLEYGKFQQQKRQMTAFLNKIASISPKHFVYAE